MRLSHAGWSAWMQHRRNPFRQMTPIMNVPNHGLEPIAMHAATNLLLDSRSFQLFCLAACCLASNSARFIASERMWSSSTKTPSASDAFVY